jgi:hypothetical protein
LVYSLQLRGDCHVEIHFHLEQISCKTPENAQNQMPVRFRAEITAVERLTEHDQSDLGMSDARARNRNACARHRRKNDATGKSKKVPFKSERTSVGSLGFSSRFEVA